MGLLVHNNSDGISAIVVRNTGLVLATEIYIKKKVYNCSKDAKTIYSVSEEDTGWYIKELPPTETVTKNITAEEKKQIINEAAIEAKGSKLGENLESVIEFNVEFHRQSDFKTYSFRQAYFLKELDLLWSEEGIVKDNPYYNKIFNLVRSYKKQRKYFFPSIWDLGKY